MNLMGMEHFVIMPGGTIPQWFAVRDLLAAHGFTVQLRMIDNQLAFPEEEPSPDWHELRLGTPQGMITVRREADRLRIVTWGNADAAMREAWNAIAWATAQSTDGSVDAPAGPMSAEQFRMQAELPVGLRRV
jgi:hypothetical protein